MYDSLLERDLTGGNDPAVDEFTSGTPTDPEYREGMNIWIWDDAGKIHLPRLGIESVGKGWTDDRMVHINVATPDGRVLTLWEHGHTPLPVEDGAGRPRVYAAGPLRFDLIEPFSDLKLAFDGKLVETTLKDQVSGAGQSAVNPSPDSIRPGTVPVKLDLDITGFAPPWFQGTMGGKDYVPGEHRFEQLHRVKGTISIEGKETPFSGGGLRIHRKGASRTPHGDFFGHVWHSAFFPSGRAFGFIHYYPRPDGSPKFTEGWVIEEDGRMVPAEILDRPWLQNSQVSEDTFSFVIRTAKGESRVEACSHASVFAPERRTSATATFPILQQGIGFYRWGGEEAFGMIERSSRLVRPEAAS